MDCCFCCGGGGGGWRSFNQSSLGDLLIEGVVASEDKGGSAQCWSTGVGKRVHFQGYGRGAEREAYCRRFRVVRRKGPIPGVKTMGGPSTQHTSFFGWGPYIRIFHTIFQIIAKSKG
eukprot:747107-Hanusia_phi.AAC.9